ncbi:hypothetical protein DBR46_20490 [Pseudomonas sp. KBW05]|nr:hypothetical protein DBR46_20490 [Pseudomonas sp. KBW05]
MRVRLADSVGVTRITFPDTARCLTLNVSTGPAALGLSYLQNIEAFSEITFQYIAISVGLFVVVINGISRCQNVLCLLRPGVRWLGSGQMSPPKTCRAIGLGIRIFRYVRARKSRRRMPAPHLYMSSIAMTASG